MTFAFWLILAEGLFGKEIACGLIGPRTTPPTDPSVLASTALSLKSVEVSQGQEGF